jgi:hypothetical protein
MLREAPGLSASGRITLLGPEGKLSARIVFGVARPDSLRIEIPEGTGLRFLLVSKGETLRADLPQEDAMFEGPANRETMNRLFGIDFAPKDLVSAILGAPGDTVNADWRFERARPRQITLRGSNQTRLSLLLDDPEIASPPLEAFDFGPPRGHTWSLREMSERLGLRP